MNLRLSDLIRILVFVAAVTVAIVLAGCQTPRPQHLTLPTTAAVRTPIVAAQAHVALARALGTRETALARQAVTHGIQAGSEEARELSTLVASDTAEKAGAGDQLTAALYQTGSLQRELDAKERDWNARYAALYRHDRAEAARVSVLGHALLHWRLAVLVLIVADFFAGAPIQSALHAALSAVLSAWRFVLSFALTKLPWLALL